MGILEQKCIDHIKYVIDRYSACDIALPYAPHNLKDIQKEIENMGFVSKFLFCDTHLHMAVAINDKYLKMHEEERFYMTREEIQTNANELFD